MSSTIQKMIATFCSAQSHQRLTPDKAGKLVGVPSNWQPKKRSVKVGGAWWPRSLTRDSVNVFWATCKRPMFLIQQLDEWAESNMRTNEVDSSWPVNLFHLSAGLEQNSCLIWIAWYAGTSAKHRYAVWHRFQWRIVSWRIVSRTLQ
jgi:hypothetical protein